jgi:hypothetical protein
VIQPNVTATEARIVCIGVRRGARHVQQHPLAPGLPLADAVLAAAGQYEHLSDESLAAFRALVDAERQRRGMPQPGACAVCGEPIPVDELPAGTRHCGAPACEAAWSAKRAST